MAFDFYQEIHRTQTLFSEITASRKLRHSLTTSRSTKQSFPNTLVAYLFKSGICEVRKIIFESYRIVYVGLHGEVIEALLYLPRHRCFEHTVKSLCSNWFHGCERLYFEQYNLGSFTSIANRSDSK